MEQQLAVDPSLAERLAACRQRLRPLQVDCAEPEIVPAELAERTCAALWQPSIRVMGYDAPTWTTRSWGLVDALVAVAVSLCGLLLVIPAIANSRYLAQRLVCQKNLAQIGAALVGYAESHGERFPCPATSGNAQVAGAVALLVRDEGWLTDESCFYCPGDVRGDERRVEMPSYQELVTAQGPEVPRLQQLAGGSFGYPLGVVEGPHQQLLRGVRNQHRATFALVADSPRWSSSQQVAVSSRNHGGDGQNVLFENLAARYLLGDQIGDDHLLLNAAQRVAAGLHASDAVIGGVGATPRGQVMFVAP